MQRELTRQLGSEGGLEVISFRHFDCLVFHHGEVLKLFQPTSQRIMLGRPQDRRVSGYLLVVFANELKALRPPSKRFDYDRGIFAAPIENFSGLIFDAPLVGGPVDGKFLAGVGRLLAALPDDREGWKKTFGDDFFALPPLIRLENVVRHLKGAVKFETPQMTGMKFEISIERPFG